MATKLIPSSHCKCAGNTVDITFVGKTVNAYEGTPGSFSSGSPGYTSCTNGFCQQIGYVAPCCRAGTSGGVQATSFIYELDCVDLTFDRKGDRLRGTWNKDWMSVSEDPTAAEVARVYCP